MSDNGSLLVTVMIFAFMGWAAGLVIYYVYIFPHGTDGKGELLATFPMFCGALGAAIGMELHEKL